MSYLFPAIRGRMGSTDYFQANITARDLASIAKTAGELEEWKNWSIFERFQREIASRRVEKEIVPYLVRTKDRFFGALIVLVYKPRVFDFEPLSQMNRALPGAYREASDSIGFLTIEGGDLVVLDGQHRLAALRGVVTAGNELEGPYRDDVVNDELCVIFIGHESFEKTRRIFNKVNRYAKPTSDSDNILTSEDDGCAIVSRWLVEEVPPLGLSGPVPPFSTFKELTGEPLVEWRSSQLTLTSYRITSLVTVYATVQTILAANNIENFDERHRVNRPSDRELQRAYTAAAQWWGAVLEGFSVFRAARERPTSIPDLRSYHSRYGLLLTPAGQQCLMRGLQDVFNRGVAIDEAIARANRLEWRRSDPIWTDTIVYASGAMNAKESSVRLAGRLAAYRMAGRLWDTAEVLQLREDLREAKADDGFHLPRLPRVN